MCQHRKSKGLHIIIHCSVIVNLVYLIIMVFFYPVYAAKDMLLLLVAILGIYKKQLILKH